MATMAEGHKTGLEDLQGTDRRFYRMRLLSVKLNEWSSPSPRDAAIHARRDPFWEGTRRCLATPPRKSH